MSQRNSERTEEWSRALFLLSDDAQKDLVFPEDCEAISLDPSSECDAVYVYNNQTREGLLITATTPFLGFMEGPIYVGPFYTTGAGSYGAGLIFWKKSKLWLPATALDTDNCPDARSKFAPIVRTIAE